MAARADSAPQTTGRGRGAPATRVAAAAGTVVTSERDSTAPAARVPAGNRRPEASSGRREVDGTASGQPTPAVTPMDPTAAAHTTARYSDGRQTRGGGGGGFDHGYRGKFDGGYSRGGRGGG
jgi:hypothetical protein